MTSSKEMVLVVTSQNCEGHTFKRNRRTVYRKSDGREYISILGDLRELERAKDGEKFYHVDWKQIKATPLAELMGRKG